MSKVFISWSKAKSRELAIATKEVLEEINIQMEVFMSEMDIYAGEHVQEKIIQNIEQCDILVLCFTHENKKSPWLLYEAGYASGLKKTVIPILFDMDPNWHSWIDNPMNISREIRMDNDFEKSFIKGFQIKSTKFIRNKFSNYRNKINLIKDRYRQVDVQCEEFIEKIVNIDTFKINSPYFKDKTAYFLTGFETFELWKAIIQSFLYTGKYLWIYGRKNMKLFGGNFNELFAYLDEKATDESMSGIDFKCLFLDPNSEEVKSAHKQQDIFLPELSVTIIRAKNTIGSNKRLQKCFRMYSNKRDEVIIRLDNCIIYSKPHFDINGQPDLMTNSRFEVFSASSERGKHCIEKYMQVWNNSISLF